MKFPIVLNNNYENQIGYVDDDGSVVLKNGFELSKSQLFDTFGNVEVEIYEYKAVGPLNSKEDEQKNLRISKFRIRCWSFSPVPLEPILKISADPSIPTGTALLVDENRVVIGKIKCAGSKDDRN